jgi:hypothetical protein
VILFGRQAGSSLFFVCLLVPVYCNYAAVKWTRRRMMIEKLTCHVYNCRCLGIYIYMIDDSNVLIECITCMAPGHFGMHVCTCVLWHFD